MRNMGKEVLESLVQMEERVRSELRVSIVLIQNGCFYEAYGQSAVMLSDIMGYKTAIRFDGVLMTGTPKGKVLDCIQEIEVSKHNVAVITQVSKVGNKVQRELHYISKDPLLNINNLLSNSK